MRGVVLINAVKEQQEQIEALSKELSEQKGANEKLRDEVDALMMIVCAIQPATCKERK